jgi:hypothetical protein
MERASIQVDVVSAKKPFTVVSFPGCETQNMDRVDQLANGVNERSYAGAALCRYESLRKWLSTGC